LRVSGLWGWGLSGHKETRTTREFA
jgi:hypothetical protein